MGWLCPVGKGFVSIGAGLPAVCGAPHDWEDACDAAALWGCRLVVSVGQVLPGGDRLAANGLPVFAQACLSRRMDWSHCFGMDGLLHPLASSWAVPLSLGGRVWVESSSSPVDAWPAACAFLQAAGLDRQGVASLEGADASQITALMRIWDHVALRTQTL